ncbi:MAG TPA: TonB-dependent receptor [Bacteroidia bacterium]|nr:TonB-dependent receptor [Bacteroidia bacterium]HRH06955.1 TonB-dependent receptor [Bacteroidia bacterium]HRH62190.1 TonB-dependent receptor [Bacteroidia bacterium]
MRKNILKTRPIYTYLFFLVFWAVNFLTAHQCQAQSISGSVKDAKSGEPLVGVSVVIKGTTTGAVTDFDGNFKFTTNAALPLILQASYVGYLASEKTINSLSDKITFQLKSNEVQLKGVEITDVRISEKQKESPLTVESMDIIGIKQTSAANFYEGLGQLKGVDLTSASIGFKVINTRGFNSTSPVRSLQIIDGVDNQAPGLNFSLGNFLGCSELDVQKVDLIVGASSAFYGPNAFNGVISMNTKSPFIHQGFSASIKTGERELFEGALRYAKAFKNKKGEDKFAIKANFCYMRANDWVADNLDATPQSLTKVDNPGGYDAVNRYGDEVQRGDTGAPKDFPGLKRWNRTGYEEKDIVDYNTKNLKAALSLHYKVKPEVELIYASNFGNGTTVYQGDNRYSLKDILFFQNRIELKKENKYFIRAYATNENAGKSYDAVFTALLLQDSVKPDDRWSQEYRNYWSLYNTAKVKKLPDFPSPPTSSAGAAAYYAAVSQLLDKYPDSLLLYHQNARAYADGIGNPIFGYLARLNPGTEEYNNALKEITSRTSFTSGGSRFYDKSALYHVQGEYKFTPAVFDFTVGANYRMYRPDSKGTIFSDTLYSTYDTVYNDNNKIVSTTKVNHRKRITNQEFGVYAGIEKKLMNEKLKLNLTGRMDKNQNFNFVFSPALSAVYTIAKEYVLRASFSSAIRNPTLTDQYLYYNVGRAILLGNIDGVDSLVTIPSLYDFLDTRKRDTLSYFNVKPIRPEQVKSLEFGARLILLRNLFLDASYYYSFYKYFIGYKIGANLDYDTATNIVYKAQVYRVAANSEDRVTTQGFSIGMTYFFRNYYSIGGNYSWNVLNQKDSIDPIIPAFNTPKHKYNLTFSGRDIEATVFGLRMRHWGYSINYKWIQGFVYEGSPQFTGEVPTYDMLDVQVNYTIPKIYTTIKVGASNVLNNKKFQVYGGPRVGRLAYVSLLFDLGNL